MGEWERTNLTGDILAPTHPFAHSLLYSMMMGNGMKERMKTSKPINPII